MFAAVPGRSGLPANRPTTGVRCSSLFATVRGGLVYRSVYGAARECPMLRGYRTNEPAICSYRTITRCRNLLSTHSERSRAHRGTRLVGADDEKQLDNEEGAGVGDSVGHGPSSVPLVCGAEQDLVDVYPAGLGEGLEDPLGHVLGPEKLHVAKRVFHERS
jgi:hypothetical protein